LWCRTVDGALSLQNARISTTKFEWRWPYGPSQRLRWGQPRPC
jgi:hypothetical protein